MLPSAGTGQPPAGPDWVVELAWTGHRCLAYVQPGRRTRLRSSGGTSMTAAYPELGPELERRSPPRGMILDGTLVARGEEHAPRAARLQRRSARHRPSERHIERVPVDFQVADLLWLDGHPIVELPYRDRRTLLEGLGFDAAPVWATSPIPVSELPTLLCVAEAKGVDALHARHLGSRYKPGQRSPLWVRVPVPRTGRVVVGGWTPVEPGRPERIASLLVGVPTAGGLAYVGRVGVAGDERRHVTGLRALRRDTSPFVDGPPADVAHGAIWVEPRVVGLVEFTGFTAAGRLRLPHWRGPVGAGAPAVRWARRADPPGEPQAPGAPTKPVRSGAGGGSDASGDPAGSGEPMASTGSAAGEGPAASAGPAGPGEPAASGGAPTAGEPAASGLPPGGTTTPGTPVAGPATASPPGTTAPGATAGGTEPAAGPTAGRTAEPEALERRRLEQHFVYNSLNTIAALIRTDPGRARDLLVGFADLTRATDQPQQAATTLARELEAVRGYLALEQARFGRRLAVRIDVPDGLLGATLEPLRLLTAVRAAVQLHIEPRPDGGVLTVAAGRGTLTVTGGEGPPTVVELPR